MGPNDLTRDFQALTSESPGNIRHILMSWFNCLPIRYKNCLLYLSIFPQYGVVIRRASLVRRWAADNLVIGRNGSSAQDEAERCFSVLLEARFLLHTEKSVAGKVKTCRVNGLISKFIRDIAREEKVVDADLQQDVSSRISVHNRSKLQQVMGVPQASHPKACWNICMQSTSNEDGHTLDVVTKLLQTLPALARLGLLRVLDLEGYEGLKNVHLENICKVFQLRYLNLRRTNITILPEQIENLQHLETLDIRETAVSSFSTRTVVLPMLKHMLAGCTQHPNEETKSFSTVRLPRGVGEMINLQILCHVDVSRKEDRLTEIRKLLKLRKLGVVFGSNEHDFKHLLQPIEKLNQSLLSLSIHVEVRDSHETADINAAEPTAFSPPILLQALSIRGITRGLPRWIMVLDLLTELTLGETHLTKEDMAMLGRLSGLRFLRLLDSSYVETKFTLQEGEFDSLEFILIEGSHITDITFNKTPRIEKIVWNFTEMKSLDGISRLPSLTRLELIGNCDPTATKEELSAHPNQPVVTHNGQIINGAGEDN